MGKDRDLHEENFNADDPEIERALAVYRGKIDSAKDVTELLLSEAKFTKSSINMQLREPDFRILPGIMTVMMKRTSS